MEEEEYEQLIKYNKTFYPNRKIKIQGFGLTNLDTISNHKDLFGIINTYNIRCSYCNEPIKDEDWIAVFHSPKEQDKPTNLLFFCHSKKCPYWWAKKKEVQKH